MIGQRYAYRVLYEMAYGYVPAVLHHTCGNPWCVNPQHLEPMTRAQHMREHGHVVGDQVQAAKTHCPQGHPYDEENTYHWHGERHCRACRQEAKRRYNEKRKEIS